MKLQGVTFKGLHFKMLEFIVGNIRSMVLILDCLRRQDWRQVPCNSTDNPLTGMQAADAETTGGDIQRSAFYMRM